MSQVGEVCGSEMTSLRWSDVLEMLWQTREWRELTFSAAPGLTLSLLPWSAGSLTTAGGPDRIAAYNGAPGACLAVCCLALVFRTVLQKAKCFMVFAGLLSFNHITHLHDDRKFVLVAVGLNSLDTYRCTPMLSWTLLAGGI